jgi:ankyrin repeat protein
MNFEEKFELEEKIFTAIENQNVAEVLKLLNQGVDPNLSHVLSGYTLLHFATSKGNIEIVKMLLDYGADLQDCHNTSRASTLSTAAFSGHPHILRFLIENGGQLGKDELDIIKEVESIGLDFLEIAQLIKNTLI